MLLEFLAALILAASFAAPGDPPPPGAVGDPPPPGVHYATGGEETPITISGG